MSLERPEALRYFLNEMQLGHITYEFGRLVRRWELRRGWLLAPRLAEKFTSNGYLLVRSNPKAFGPLYVMAHRLIWAFFHGEPASGLVINHLNGIKTDNRIENLELVTQTENVQHALNTGLTKPALGLCSGRGKLSDEDVREIRRLVLNGAKQADVAERFGVRPNQISRIASGKRRAYVS